MDTAKIWIFVLLVHHSIECTECMRLQYRIQSDPPLPRQKIKKKKTEEKVKKGGKGK